jgi:hypothetical protein
MVATIFIVKVKVVIDRSIPLCLVGSLYLARSVDFMALYMPKRENIGPPSGRALGAGWLSDKLLHLAPNQGREQSSSSIDDVMRIRMQIKPA